MDETDTGAVKDPQALSAEAARQWAEQQRAAARAQFQTPTWLGPARDSSEPPAIPAQVEPEHDDFTPAVLEKPGEPIPATAHWAEKAGPRLVAGGVLLLALAGTIGFLIMTITTQSVVAIAGLAACALVAVIFRGALMGSGITTVDLKGSIMRIRKAGVLEVVNLADPAQRVELIGTPDQSGWRLHVEAIDGRVIEIGPREVDAVEVHRIVDHYRRIAERDRRDRDRRFNR